MVEPKTQRELVLEALVEGPCTSFELARRTGLPMVHCSAYANALWKNGEILRSKNASASSPNRQTGLYLYSLKVKR